MCKKLATLFLIASTSSHHVTVRNVNSHPKGSKLSNIQLICGRRNFKLLHVEKNLSMSNFLFLYYNFKTIKAINIKVKPI